MTILGIIVEYNPFHNGHLYHLEQAKKLIEPEVTIAVMSGPFLQRGEAAIVDKWTRTKMAILNGVDLVIELPTVYATQSADSFAFGAVSLLNQLYATDFVFGSETNQVNQLDKIADMLLDEPAEFQLYMENMLSNGHSYPKALALSLAEYQKQSAELNDFEILKPNDILGLQYLLQNKKINGAIKGHGITRKLVNYHDQKLHQHSFASATAIRKNIFETENVLSVKKVMPDSAHQLLEHQSSLNRLHRMEHFFMPLQLMILNQSIEKLQEIHGMTEGLEHRIKESIMTAYSYSNLVEQIKTKRYTSTRIQRLLYHLLLQLTKENVEKLNLNQGPTYIRVLGFNENGRSYLSKIKNQLSIPLITKIKKDKPMMLEFDLLASHIYEIGFPQAEQRKLEYQQTPIYQTI